MLTKLANNENVTVEVVVKICKALDCKMDDVIEIIDDAVDIKKLKNKSETSNEGIDAKGRMAYGKLYF